MEPRQRLDAAALGDAMTACRDALRANEQVINRLNVYPVPDGDTGTNMALTLESVLAELGGVVGAPTMPAVCRAISHGSLMGARGNSGIILSQILRGATGVLASRRDAGAREVAEALDAGSRAAASAVMNPVEGTILTVARGAAEAACATAGGGASLSETVIAARSAGIDALARTPSLLGALAEAGVVDAGGAGFVLLLDALLQACGVQAGPPLRGLVPEQLGAPGGSLVGSGGAGTLSGGAGDLRYEVMYLLEAPEEAIPAFKDVWAGLGDSIVVVGGESTWNCHIHTDDVGAAIEASLDAGRPSRIRVTDLADQVQEERWVREARSVEEALERPRPAVAPPETAVVAVATGEGIRRIFHSLGVQEVVAGGQSMNPSTAEILDAVEAAPAGCVVVLPNNDNIVAVAERVATLASKQVRVVRTSSVTEGFAALMDYDPQSDLDSNTAAMGTAAARVVCGEVTQAVRASGGPVGPIAPGDWLGLSAAGIEVVEHSSADAACRLLDKLVGPENEIATVIEGEGSTPADTRLITEWLAERHPHVAVEVHHGGQPSYPYLLSVE